jgi:hypothetical protein
MTNQLTNVAIELYLSARQALTPSPSPAEAGEGSKPSPTSVGEGGCEAAG